MSNKAHIHNISLCALDFELPRKCWKNKRVYIKAAEECFATIFY